jgi:hypothetical protein
MKTDWTLSSWFLLWEWLALARPVAAMPPGPLLDTSGKP